MKSIRLGHVDAMEKGFAAATRVLIVWAGLAFMDSCFTISSAAFIRT